MSLFLIFAARSLQCLNSRMLVAAEYIFMYSFATDVEGVWWGNMIHSMCWIDGWTWLEHSVIVHWIKLSDNQRLDNWDSTVTHFGLLYIEPYCIAVPSQGTTFCCLLSCLFCFCRTWKIPFLQAVHHLVRVGTVQTRYHLLQSLHIPLQHLVYSCAYLDMLKFCSETRRKLSVCSGWC